MYFVHIILLLCSLAGTMGRPSETNESSRNAGGYGFLRPGYNNYPGGYPGNSGYPGYGGYPGQYPGGGGYNGYPGGYGGYGQGYPGYGGPSLEGGYNGYPGGYGGHGQGYPGYGGYRPGRPGYPGYTGYQSGYGHRPNYFSGSSYPFGDGFGDNLSFGRRAGEIKRNLSPTQA